ncbi:MAG: hypothetical protein K6A35_07065 [bacterium]|nr:hypothetical protein [bacterium]
MDFDFGCEDVGFADDMSSWLDMDFDAGGLDALAPEEAAIFGDTLSSYDGSAFESTPWEITGPASEPFLSDGAGLSSEPASWETSDAAPEPAPWEAASAASDPFASEPAGLVFEPAPWEAAGAASDPLLSAGAGSASDPAPWETTAPAFEAESSSASAPWNMAEEQGRKVSFGSIDDRKYNLEQADYFKKEVEYLEEKQANLISEGKFSEAKILQYDIDWDKQKMDEYVEGAATSTH